MRPVASPQLLACALALTLAPSWGTARARTAGLDQVVARTVRGNYEALHGCFRKALAEDRGSGGTLFVQVTLGAGDAVKAARVRKDELKHKAAVACILTWVRGWTFQGAAAAGAGAGSEITIPLTFRAAPTQFAVRLEDLAEADGGRETAHRVLLTGRNVGARQAGMAWIKLAAATQLPAAEASDRILYVLGGRGVATVGGRRRKLTPGAALWAPRGAAVGLAGPLEALLVVAPAGSEGSLTLAGPGAQAPGRRARGDRPPVVVKGGAPLRGRDGEVRRRPLLAARQLGHARLHAGLIRYGKAARPYHVQLLDGQTELLYVLDGAAELTLSGGAAGAEAAQELAAGHAVCVPPGGDYRLRVTRALVALQILAPGAPPAARERSSKTR